jgi:exosortase
MTSTAAAASLKTRTAIFGAYCAVVALVSWRVFRELFDLSRSDPSASHVLLIPLVTIALFARDRSMLSAARFAPGAGAIAIVAGLLLAWGFQTVPSGPTGGLTLRAAAVVILWLGGFLLFYGPRALRAGLFPLLFLGFMIPIPHVILDGVTEFLKVGTTETISRLFSLVGTPYHREAFVFHLPKVTIEVADECSGIRSTLALVMTALLVGYFCLRSPWKRALLVLAIVPVTILKNAIRIVTLSLLSIHVDRSFLDGRLHHDGGIVFFLLSLAVLHPLFLLLRNSEARLETQRP